MVAPLRWMSRSPDVDDRVLEQRFYLQYLNEERVGRRRGQRGRDGVQVLLLEGLDGTQLLGDELRIVRRYVMRAEVEPDVARRRRSVALA